MTAGKFPDTEKFTIYRGTTGSVLLQFESPGGVPTDLSGRSFVCEVRQRGGLPVLLTITATVTDAEGGEITLSWTEQQTASLKPGKRTIGLLDDLGTLWIEDICHILQKTPENT